MAQQNSGEANRQNLLEISSNQKVIFLMIFLIYQKYMILRKI